MLFKVQRREADTCGNSWYEKPPLYVEADSLHEVIGTYPRWEGLGGWDVEEIKVQRLGSKPSRFSRR